jgi:DNA-binding response OmpR family regulator
MSHEYDSKHSERHERNLTMREMQCFKYIADNSAEGPLDSKTLFGELYGREPECAKDLYAVYVLIYRIRKKLGRESILTVEGEGFISLIGE